MKNKNKSTNKNLNLYQYFSLKSDKEKFRFLFVQELRRYFSFDLEEAEGEIKEEIKEEIDTSEIYVLETLSYKETYEELFRRVFVEELLRILLNKNLRFVENNTVNDEKEEIPAPVELNQIEENENELLDKSLNKNDEFSVINGKVYKREYIAKVKIAEKPEKKVLKENKPIFIYTPLRFVETPKKEKNKK